MKTMDRVDINPWANICERNWSAILIGNGASIAIHKEFAYADLRRFLGKDREREKDLD